MPANAVVGGVVHQHRHSVWVLPDSTGHLLPLHAQGDAQARVHLRVDIDRDGTAKHQGVDDAAVDIPGHDDLVPPLAGGQHHALHRAGGAPHHQKGVGRAEGVGGQLLRLPDDRDGVAQVVQGFHAVHVDADTLLPQEAGQLRVAPAPLVPGHIEGNDPHLPEGLERLVDRGLVLVQGMFFFHLPTPRSTKKHKLHLNSLCLDQFVHDKLQVPCPAAIADKRLQITAGGGRYVWY